MDTCINTWQPTGQVGSRGGAKQAGLKALEKKNQTLLSDRPKKICGANIHIFCKAKRGAS